MFNQESIEALWLRVEPGIRKLMPKMSQVDFLRTKALVKRVLAASLKPVDSAALDEAEKYLMAGNLDIPAARILFEAQQFALSVYHIQQAAEKAMKAYCLGIGALTIEQVRRSHRTPLLILSVIDQWPGSEMATIFSGIANKDYKRCAKEAKRFVNSDPAGQQRLAKLPLRSDKREFGIEVFLELCDQLMLKNPFLEQKEDEVKRVLLECLPEYTNSIMSYSLIKYGQAAGQCYILGTLTFVHESCTRYPGGYVEPQDYTKQLGIVEAAPELIGKIARAFNLVGDVIAISRKRGNT